MIPGRPIPPIPAHLRAQVSRAFVRKIVSHTSNDYQRRREMLVDMGAGRCGKIHVIPYGDENGKKFLVLDFDKLDDVNVVLK